MKIGVLIDRCAVQPFGTWMKTLRHCKGRPTLLPAFGLGALNMQRCLVENHHGMIYRISPKIRPTPKMSPS